MIDLKITDVRPMSGDSGFLIDDGKTSILYDTGFGFTGDKLCENIKKILGSRKLDYIFLTHSHYDHALGSAYILRRYPEAKVVAGVYAADIFRRDGAKRVMKELDANELIGGVINTFAVKVEQGGGKIIASLEAEDPFVYVDEMHFTNVVFNLMDNAVKYKRQDEPLLLNIHTWNANGNFMLSIQDNGIGISKENIKKIFDKFYRVHTGNLHDVKGFGLGLAYVKQIIQAHKGSIRAESEIGVGTNFIIVLPLK